MYHIRVNGNSMIDIKGILSKRAHVKLAAQKKEEK